MQLEQGEGCRLQLAMKKSIAQCSLSFHIYSIFQSYCFFFHLTKTPSQLSVYTLKTRLHITCQHHDFLMSLRIFVRK